MSNLAGGIKKTVFKAMFNRNIDKLIESINIVVSKNRRFFSVEDIELLDRCLLELEQLKVDNTETTDEKLIKSRLLTVIRTLDLFFGLADYIEKWSNL